jgi:hypothetical protein
VFLLMKTTCPRFLCKDPFEGHHFDLRYILHTSSNFSSYTYSGYMSEGFLARILFEGSRYVNTISVSFVLLHVTEIA